MQVRSTVAASDAVQGHQRIVFRRSQTQQQISLLLIGAIQFRVTKYFIGPQTAFATITGLTPEQQLGTLLLQGFTGCRESFVRRVFRRQLVGHRGDIAPCADLTIKA